MLSPSDRDEHRKALRIGNRALEMGLVTAEQLRDALTFQAHQAASGAATDRLDAILVSKGYLARAQADALLRDAGAGTPSTGASELQAFGKFKLVRELGHGGMGVVYEAVDGELNRKVALKLILPGRAADRAQDEERFVREARLLASLPAHPFLVGVHEAGVNLGQRYLATEFVEGMTLAAFRESTRPSLRRQVEILRDVALGIQHAHEHGVVHRDLKPANVIVETSGRPRISDFGLAKAWKHETSSITADGKIVGTPAFMSPEQAQGHKTIDHRTDLYALGAMLYETLTSRKPHEGETTLQTLVKTVNEPVRRPSKVMRGIAPVDRALERICLKALQKDPEDRHPTARAFADELTEWLKSPDAPAAGGRAPRWVLPAAAGLAVLLGATLMWSAIPADLPASGPLPGMNPAGTNDAGRPEYVDSRDGAVMILIPAGEFVMGRDDGPENERPAHRVHLDAYLIDKTEVTVGRFRKFVEGTGHVTEAERQGWAWVFDDSFPEGVAKRPGVNWRSPGYPQDDLHPVTCVSRDDALAFCAWADKRLPTEAEWEKAARGTDGRAWPWGGEWDSERANVGRAVQTTPAGRFAAGASPFGALDMAGNLSEYCSDWFDPAYFRRSEERNPKGPAQGETRVLKGGAFVDDGDLVRSTRRIVWPPGWGVNHADGFRCARNAK